ncbi:MAG TPA: hypothetical protein VHS96_08010, partial [Bacteroidia bacterium]|nr:hypothetical protein [Bacteroidia bacterium]
MNSTRRRLVVVLFLSLFPLLQVAQRLTDPTSKLDEKRRLRGNAKVARLSRAITAGKEGDAEKVTAIYRW